MSAASMVGLKAWLDTRWRFTIGLGVMLCSAASVVLFYPQVVALLPSAANFQAKGALGEEIRKAVELSSSFRGYVWHQWSHQNLMQMGVLFAILLGAGSVFATGGGAMFTLALPVSRRRLLVTRAATALAELLGILLLSTLTISIAATAVGESFSFLDAIAYGVCAFAGASVFLSVALLLSTLFTDVWRPLGMAVALAVLIGLVEAALQQRFPLGIFQTMNAETYFRSGEFPWLGVFACAAGSAAIIYAAVLNLERQDF